MKQKVTWLIVVVAVILVFFCLNDIVFFFAPKELATKKINFEDYQNLKKAYTYTDDLSISTDSIWETVKCTGWAFVETEEPTEGKKGNLILKGRKNSYITPELTFSTSTIADEVPGWKQIGDTNNKFTVEFSTVNLASDDYEIYVYLEENANAVGLVETGIGFTKNGVKIEGYTIATEAEVPTPDEMTTRFDYGWWDVYQEDSYVNVQGWQIKTDVVSEKLAYYVIFTGDNGNVTSFKLSTANNTTLGADYGVDYVGSGFRGNIAYELLPDTAGTRCIVAENDGTWYCTEPVPYALLENASVE